MKYYLQNLTRKACLSSIKGISLLEVMLSLSLVAIIIMAATRYYQVTETSRKIVVATENINTLYTALQQYYNDNGSMPNSLNELITNAMLPTHFATFANPWGSIENYSPITSASASLTFNNVPSSACKNLAQKISSSYETGEVSIGNCMSSSVSGMKICFFNKQCS